MHILTCKKETTLKFHAGNLCPQRVSEANVKISLIVKITMASEPNHVCVCV